MLENLDAINADPAASAVYEKEQEKLQQMHMQSFMTDMQGGMKTGSWGQAARGATLGLGAALGAESSTAQGFVGLLGDAAALAGDIGGGYLHGMNQADEARSAMTKAANLAEAGNIQARNQLVKDANSAYGQMNSANAAAGANMTDAAIGQAGAFESGMQAIGSSGISGSGNMKRNLQYGQDKADAQEQLQFELMGNQAQGVQDAMVNSFDELSNNKAGAMADAYAGTLGGLINQDRQITQQYQQQAMALAPTHNDYMAAIQTGVDAISPEGQVAQEKPGTANQGFFPQEQQAGGDAARMSVDPATSQLTEINDLGLVDVNAINTWLRDTTQGGKDWKAKMGNGANIGGRYWTPEEMKQFIKSPNYKR